MGLLCVGEEGVIVGGVWVGERVIVGGEGVIARGEEGVIVRG